MPRLAAPQLPVLLPAPSKQPTRAGLRTYRENLLFSSWPLLSADKKAIKNEKGGGGGLEGFPQHRPARPLRLRVCGKVRCSEPSPGVGPASVTHPLPSVPLQGQTWFWGREPQAPVPSLRPFSIRPFPKSRNSAF